MARGMANDEPTVSQANTAEFYEGFDRTFGDQPMRQPGRKSYVYRGGRLVERGGPDDTGFYDEADEARLHVVSDLYMNGVTVPGPDGPIDIGSRAKRRAYMRSPHPTTGEPRELADMSDFKGVWAEGEKKREAIRNGTYGAERRRESIARILYETEKMDRKRR